MSSYRYQTRRSDEPRRTRLVELARSKPRFGYRRLHVLLVRSGEHVNHKRVHRVYRAASQIAIPDPKHQQIILGLVGRGEDWSHEALREEVQCGANLDRVITGPVSRSRGRDPETKPWIKSVVPSISGQKWLVDDCAPVHGERPTPRIINRASRLVLLFISNSPSPSV
jgi:hypothetical protein